MKTFEQVYASLPTDGWLSEAEARLLWEVVHLTNGPILEVGCFKGRSTCLLAATGRQLYCVDPFKGFSEEDPDGNATVEAWFLNVTSRGYSVGGVKDWDVIPAYVRESISVWLWQRRVEKWPKLPVEFAYLDGDHTYEGTKAQIEAASSARIVAVHDVNDTGGGVAVKRACLELLGPWATRAERLAVWRK